MPEIDIERRPNTGMSWLPWAIGAVLLALIAWGIYTAVRPNRAQQPAGPSDQVAGERQESPMAGREGMETTPAVLPVGAIFRSPETYQGQTVEGTATVREVVTNRGYWVDEDGTRMFVVSETITETPSVRQGDRIFVRGQVMRPGQPPATGPTPQMSPETQQLVSDQSAYLLATEVRPAEEMTGTPGTMNAPGTTDMMNAPGTPGMMNTPGTEPGTAPGTTTPGTTTPGTTTPGTTGPGTSTTPGATTAPGGTGTSPGTGTR